MAKVGITELGDDHQNSRSSDGGLAQSRAVPKSKKQRVNQKNAIILLRTHYENKCRQFISLQLSKMTSNDEKRCFLEFYALEREKNEIEKREKIWGIFKILFDPSEVFWRFFF